MNKKIVTLGASAGGLAALEAFFKSVPAEPDCSFVIVQHLSPDFKSLMAQLLTAYTELPITEVSSGIQIQNNRIYLIPAGCLMTIKGGAFSLFPRNTEQMPINTFMESLAQDAGNLSVGVILSGTGTDGTAGCKAIREAGGLVITQEPSSAEFPSMPESIMRKSYNHYTLRPQAIWPILRLFKGDLDNLTRDLMGSELLETTVGDGELGYSDIFSLLKRLYQIDFSNYKITSVNRRIERRMQQTEKESVGEYLDYIIANREESDALYHDLLIGVTEFMRDPDAFHDVAESVIRPIFAGLDPPEDFRIWVAGCASGEEAYSLAIVTDEIARACKYNGNINIFATDIHKNSIQRSGTGIYTKDEVANLSPERLNRYFKVTETGDFRIKPEFRQRVVFAQHNLLVDPPFTKMDIVTCRNLLIYLKPEAQDSVLRSLHYALKMGGSLFLGSSESLGELGPSFKTISSRNKIFRKHGDAHSLGRPTQLFTKPNFNGARVAPGYTPASSSTTTIDKNLLQAYDLVLKRYAPSGVLIDRNREVRHFFGNSSQFLISPSGRVDSDFLSMLSGDLKLAVSTTLQRVISNNQTIRSEGVSCTTRHGEEIVDVTITPYIENERDLGLILVTFETRGDQPDGLVADESESFRLDEETHSRILMLEDELRSSKENLQATVEELQTSNEELQAINEEVQVSNEELQSTNEELHSMNEELYTVNAELEQKNLQLIELNEDHENLLTNTEDGVLYIDRDLRIRKFNPAIGFAFNLLPQDIGRPIEHIAYNLEGQGDMLDEINQVLREGIRKEREISTRAGTTYLRRFTPFLGVDGNVSGVVLTFTDVTEASRMRSRLARSMESARMAWWEWDIHSDRLDVHAEGECILGYDCEHIDRTSDFWFSRVHPDDVDQVRQSLDDCLQGKTDEWNCEHRYSRSGTEPIVWEWVHEIGRVSRRAPDGSPIEMVGTTMNINPRKLLELDLWTSKEDAERALEVKNQFLSVMSHEMRTPLNGINGMADLLALEIDDPALRKHIELLTDSSKNLLNLINQILDYTQVQSGTMDLSFSDCDVKILVETVLKIIHHGKPSDRTEIETSFNLQHHVYQVDAVRLRQVLINVIGNAFKFTDESGHVTIEVSDEKGPLEFTVTDNGVGIREDFAERVFNPFTQQDSSTTRQFGGVGLGLSVSKEIIELMGGKINIESREDEGTKVSFSVQATSTPREESPQTETPLPTPADKEKDAALSDSDVRRKKVLVVDDDHANLVVIEKMLFQIGFDVVTAESEARAQERLGEHADIDIAVLDLHLPQGSGFDLVNYIRRDADDNPYQDLVIFACTADASIETKNLVKAAKFDGLLIKPVRLAHLRETLPLPLESES